SFPVGTMTNVLTSNPSFTWTGVPVPNHSGPPRPSDPGGTIPGTNDAVMSLAYFGGVLAASRTVGVSGHAAARVDEFDVVSFSSPVLVQTLVVDQGPGVHTFLPALDINSEYDLGIIFMESSPTENLSIYITGQNVNDYGSGQLQSPVLTFQGIAPY